jgi:hypothetical protein
MVANAAFYYGALRALVDDERPIWSQLSFSAAEENFRDCAKHGLDATVYWPGMGRVKAAELVQRRLLPMAYEGLDRWGVAPAVRDHYLGIIGERVTSGRNGADWQVATVQTLESRGLDRPTALTEMLRLYAGGMHANLPVHTWPVP